MGSVMTHMTVNRVAFRAAIVLAGCLLLATTRASVADADPTCASGSLSALMGTTCDVGALQFFFIAYSSPNSTGETWTASDFTFAPVSNGFRLTFDGGPQSITAPSDGFAWDFFNLYYSVTDLDGNFLGQGVTGGSQTSAANGGTANSEYSGETHETYNITSTYIEGYNGVGDGAGYSLEDYISGAPFSVGESGNAFPFFLYVTDGGTASWDGTPTTFTFESTPEPSSLLLFATGLLGIVFITRKKLAR
jgi:hypothetical protein